MHPQDLETIFRDIESYGGDFGDGVDVRNINPYATAREAKADLDVSGLGVALLVVLQTTIDNGGHEHAVDSHRTELRDLLRTGVFKDHPIIFYAALAFFESESRFNHELRRVYHEIVRPRTRSTK